ncbi:MAG: class I SAM-dependent methyltransferase [Firmicutes bacterium]|nr:class I SAM-dependent methyltransferase [Bacillota bacterium]
MEQSWKNGDFVDHYNKIYSMKNDQIANYLECLSLNSDDVFIDFGCGNGDMLFEASKIVKLAAGLDMSEDQLELAKEKTKGCANVQLIKSDFLSYNPGDLIFSKASARKSLHHLTDDEKVRFIGKIAPFFKKDSLFLMEDGIFTFDRSETEEKLPQIMSEAEVYYNRKWQNIKEDFTHCILHEFPTGINLWEKAFASGGFEIINRHHITCFYARIIAKKVV